MFTTKLVSHLAHHYPHYSSSITNQIPKALAAIFATAAMAADPVKVKVDPICNQPNNEISVFPEAMSPAIPKPAHPVTLQDECCYPRSHELGNQVCACKAWDAWCLGRFSTCCGEARACTEYCKCIPHERFCDHPDNKFETECDDPYAGQGDVTWAMDLGMNEAPECPSDN